MVKFGLLRVVLNLEYVVFKIVVTSLFKLK